MGVTFQVAETPRVYVERIDISGNTMTHDKVIRREFRLAEGDPFNNVRVTPLARPHPVARLLPGEFGDRAGAGLGARPGRARRRRSRSARPASCSSRPASRASSASSSTSRSASATSWAAARSCAPRSIIRAIRSRSSSASPSPICSTATSRSASTSTGATINSFNFIGNERTTTYEQVTHRRPDPRRACR